MASFSLYYFVDQRPAHWLLGIWLLAFGSWHLALGIWLRIPLLSPIVPSKLRCISSIAFARYMSRSCSYHQLHVSFLSFCSDLQLRADLLGAAIVVRSAQLSLRRCFASRSSSVLDLYHLLHYLLHTSARNRVELSANSIPQRPSQAL